MLAASYSCCIRSIKRTEVQKEKETRKKFSFVVGVELFWQNKASQQEYKPRISANPCRTNSILPDGIVSMHHTNINWSSKVILFRKHNIDDIEFSWRLKFCIF
eukprot:Seg861.8 transcript_id=Seg861.8/GoldUCD/mRNA.D3Y31 product="hypothetical protein" protein_id=Seg861.8/GoldUCD/D3Y31